MDYEPFGGVLKSEGTGARTGYIDREEDAESGLGFYGVRQYESEYGRFVSVDKLWKKHPSLQVYDYAASSPVIARDYTGLDYDVIFNREAKTVTVSAVFFANSTGVQSAQTAVDRLNGLSGQTTYEYQGDEYTINFDLSVSVSQDPLLDLSLSQSEFTLAGDQKEGGKSTNTNAYSIVSDDDGIVPSDAGGVTRYGSVMHVKESYQYHDIAPVHELLHSLGIGHHLTGIMTASIHDPNSSPTIFDGTIQEVVENAVTGEHDPATGTGTVKNEGD